jgi:hypothetical protein
MFTKMRIILLVALSLTTVRIYSQANILSQTIAFKRFPNINTQKDYLDYIASTYGVVFTYNARVLYDESPVTINSFNGSLEKFIRQIFEPKTLSIQFIEPNKIILKPINDIELTPIVKFKISGRIIDSIDREPIVGALIIEKNSKKSVISDEDGYFFMYLSEGQALLEAKFFSYGIVRIPLSINGNKYIPISLKVNNNIPEIIIDGKSQLNLNSSGQIIELSGQRDRLSISGENDLIASARSQAGVQSGGEGQNGLLVRGGSPDQNLVLVEGVSLYEYGHTAGLSSIFVEESINSASLIKNGFPARYSGRLSSVLDIKFKNGDPNAHHSMFSVGLPGAKFHLNGPLIKNKTTYNVSGKTSWLNLFLDKVFTPYTRYNSIRLNYSDIMGKITHQFSKQTQISFTAYNTNDRLSLTKNDTINASTEAATYISDKNALGWNSKLFSLKASHIVSDKYVLKVQLGYLAYNNQSQSSYDFLTVSSDSTSRDILNVLTSTKINDFNSRFDLDYYISTNHTLRAGVNVIHHRSNPGIKQSKVIIDGQPSEIIDNDSVRVANEMNFYVEDQFVFANKLLVYAGFNIAAYNIDQGQGRFSSLQPRLNAIWTPHQRHTLTFSYSKMAQFSHLLTNTGLGLPSALWVPSTPTVAPEQSTQISGKYAINIGKKSSFSIGAFDKKFENIIEFTRPIELFYFLINRQSIVPIYNTSRDWERNIAVGTGRSRGIEFMADVHLGKVKTYASITNSKTEHQFPSLNKGLPFPAAHDRTWDINSGMSISLGSKWNMGLNFVYGSGRYFTLSSEEYDSFLGIKLINITDRNNYRLPPFHQLSTHVSYNGKQKNVAYRIDINVYNVYNRLNPYFVYIYQNKATNQDVGRKVSILPIIPTVNFTVFF